MQAAKTWLALLLAGLGAWFIYLGATKRTGVFWEGWAR